MRRWLLSALFLWLLFAVLHLIGGRATLSALSLTAPPGIDFGVWTLACVAYLLAWFGATLVAPILALVGLINAAIRRLKSVASAGNDGPHFILSGAPEERSRKNIQTIDARDPSTRIA